MRIHRTKWTSHYTPMSNSVLRDRRLSLAARGLLGELLSLKDGTREDIRTLSAKNPDGQQLIARAMRELVAFGYMVRRRVRDRETGKITTVVDVYDTPQNTTGKDLSEVVPNLGNPSPGQSSDLPTGESNEESNQPTHGTTDATETEDDGTGTEVGREGFSDTTTNTGPDAVEPTSIGTQSSETETVEPEIDEAELAACAEILGRIGRDYPRLALGRKEMAPLLPLVAEWRNRGVSDSSIRTILTEGLPERVHSARAFLAYRLRMKMPTKLVPAVAAPTAATMPECVECGRPTLSGGMCSMCVETSTSTPTVASLHTTKVRGIALARAALAGRLVGSLA